MKKIILLQGITTAWGTVFLKKPKNHYSIVLHYFFQPDDLKAWSEKIIPLQFLMTRELVGSIYLLWNVRFTKRYTYLRAVFECVVRYLIICLLVFAESNTFYCVLSSLSCLYFGTIIMKYTIVVLQRKLLWLGLTLLTGNIRKSGYTYHDDAKI